MSNEQKENTVIGLSSSSYQICGMNSLKVTNCMCVNVFVLVMVPFPFLSLEREETTFSACYSESVYDSDSLCLKMSKCLNVKMVFDQTWNFTTNITMKPTLDHMHCVSSFFGSWTYSLPYYFSCVVISWNAMDLLTLYLRHLHNLCTHECSDSVTRDEPGTFLTLLFMYNTGLTDCFDSHHGST